MFDFIRKHTRVLFFILVVLIIPSFVFFGIDGYSRMNEGGNVSVAKVAGQDIRQAEWDAAHREQVERIRRQMPQANAALLDSPEIKQQSLEALVRERVMLTAANQLHLITTDDRMLRLFRNDPQFAFLRNPDGSINKDLLAAQGMSTDMFEARLRQDLSMRQVMAGVGGTVLAPAAAASAALDALFQQREVQVQRFDATGYAAKVSVSQADIEAYYKDKANAAQFQAPEQSDVEYVVLDIEALKKDVNVTEDDLKKYYEQNIARYSTPEERRARHILVKADKSAPAEERAKAKAKAESLLAELRKNPAAFAELAKKNSDDPGSGANGGDLDFFGRGAMVKPFEDAAFALQKDAISDVVESDFGYHIIQLTDQRGGQRKAFDEVRASIETEVRQQLAQQRFAEAAVEFGNMVYEQSDSLKPVADKFKLSIQQAKGLTRALNPEAAASGPLASAKFREALFSSDAIENKRNTDAIETGPSQLVSGRVVQHRPAQLLPLAEVRDRVEAKVKATQAAAMARKDGEARLASLKQAPQTVLTEAAVTVSRAQTGNLPRSVVDAVLRAPDSSLPAVLGVDLGEQGYAVVKLNKVLGRDPVAAGDPVQARNQYAQAWADAESRAYYDALKKRFKVDVKAPPAAASAAGG